MGLKSRLVEQVVGTVHVLTFWRNALGPLMAEPRHSRTAGIDPLHCPLYSADTVAIASEFA